jgi:hypothetical protein
MGGSNTYNILPGPGVMLPLVVHSTSHSDDEPPFSGEGVKHISPSRSIEKPSQRGTPEPGAIADAAPPAGSGNGPGRSGAVLRAAAPDVAGEMARGPAVQRRSASCRRELAAGGGFRQLPGTVRPYEPSSEPVRSRRRQRAAAPASMWSRRGCPFMAPCGGPALRAGGQRAAGSACRDLPGADPHQVFRRPLRACRAGRLRSPEPRHPADQAPAGPGHGSRRRAGPARTVLPNREV